MPKESDEFEKLVTRIQKVIEKSGAQIEWNEHIPDSSKGESQRQVDFTIRRDGKLTIGECRLRQGKQDVTWIEQLYGKKHSLKADAVIAVSDNGFYKPAITKAREWGIALRDFHKLTDEDISQWGMQTSVSVRYLIYDTIHFGIGIPSEFWTNDRPDFSMHSKSDENNLKVILNQLVNKLDELPKEFEERWITPDYTLNVNGMMLFGLKPSSLQGSGRIMIIRENKSLPAVRAYDWPEISTLEREVFVEKEDEGETEVIKSGDNAMLTIDFSGMALPVKSLYMSCQFDLRQRMTTKINPIGIPSITLDMPSYSFGVFRVK